MSVGAYREEPSQKASGLVKGRGSEGKAWLWLFIVVSEGRNGQVRVSRLRIG